jgi:hypothetical protein
VVGPVVLLQPGIRPHPLTRRAGTSYIYGLEYGLDLIFDGLERERHQY